MSMSYILVSADVSCTIMKGFTTKEVRWLIKTAPHVITLVFLLTLA